MSIQAMKQALEALEPYKSTVLRWVTPVDKAITALHAAIEAAEKQEPFGVWHQGDTEDESDFFLGGAVEAGCCERCIPLYTTPQPAIPDGWQLVPVEPTPEMVSAATDSRVTDDPWPVGVYKAMLAAAPEVPK